MVVLEVIHQLDEGICLVGNNHHQQGLYGFPHHLPDRNA